MASDNTMKRALCSLVLLATLAAVNGADAAKRMPVRTEPIPDTETGAKAGSAGNDEPPNRPPNPGMMIYGPPTPVLGAPPTPPPPEPAAAPAPAAAPPVAVPAPAPAPAPVATPIPAAPAPIAVPVPAPAPAPVAIPAPAPIPPPAPVAVPVPVPAPAPRPAPIAAPVPAPVRPPAPIAAPAPPPAPIAIPTPASKPAPVAVPAPVIAPAKSAIAAIAPSQAPYTAPKLDAKLVEQIFSCLAPGLPQDWKRTWVVITSAETSMATKFFFTSSYRDEDAEEFVPCNAKEITQRITGLSESLAPAQRHWKSARLAIDSEGVYELVYDYK